MMLIECRQGAPVSDFILSLEPQLRYPDSKPWVPTGFANALEEMERSQRN